MAKSRFEVIIETVIRKRYEVEAKDVDFAKMKALDAKYYEGEVLSKTRVATSIKQTSPRYFVKTVGYESYVIDSRSGGVVASCNEFRDAKKIAEVLNTAEEETQ